MTDKLAELKLRLGEVSDLRSAAAVLDWDQMVLMPPAGAAVRAERLSTLHRVAHDRFTDGRVGELLDELRPLAESLEHDSDDASLIRVTRRDWEKARRVPSELEAEMTKVGSEAMEAWCLRKSASHSALSFVWRRYSPAPNSMTKPCSVSRFSRSGRR